MKPLLILCAGRSGSMYTSRLLQSAGLDFCHEGIGEDGGIGWNLPQIAEIDPERYTIWHQIREPLACCASMLTHQPGVFAMMEEIAGEAFDHRNMFALTGSAWARYNMWCAANAERTYQVEWLANDGSDEVAALLGYFGCNECQVPPRNCNTRAHRSITYDHLTCYPKIWAEIQRVCDMCELDYLQGVKR